LAQGRTTSTIAHRLFSVRNVGQIVVLDHDIEVGGHASLTAGQGRYAALVT
jgi:ABC-type multidrug transport system fused ATPase/permease subunit